MQSSDVVQLFLERDPVTLEKMPWVEIIEKATALVSPDSKIRRITVTDGFGGRGHDFAVYDEHVDVCGGLAVIVTDIPASERDWVQWLGRTARSDRRGQYAIIICQEDEPVSSYAELRTHLIPNKSNFYHANLLRKLLDIQDKKTNGRIDGLRGAIERGQLANELCEKFYYKFKRPESSENWPSCEQDQKLSVFWGAGRFTKSSLQEFKSSIGLVYASKYS